MERRIWIDPWYKNFLNYTDNETKTSEIEKIETENKPELKENKKDDRNHTLNVENDNVPLFIYITDSNHKISVVNKIDEKNSSVSEKRPPFVQNINKTDGNNTLNGKNYAPPLGIENDEQRTEESVIPLPTLNKNTELVNTTKKENIHEPIQNNSDENKTLVRTEKQLSVPNINNTHENNTINGKKYSFLITTKNDENGSTVDEKLEKIHHATLNENKPIEQANTRNDDNKSEPTKINGEEIPSLPKAKKTDGNDDIINYANRLESKIDDKNSVVTEEHEKIYPPSLINNKTIKQVNTKNEDDKHESPLVLKVNKTHVNMHNTWQVV